MKFKYFDLEKCVPSHTIGMHLPVLSGNEIVQMRNGARQLKLAKLKLFAVCASVLCLAVFVPLTFITWGQFGDGGVERSLFLCLLSVLVGVLVGAGAYVLVEDLLCRKQPLIGSEDYRWPLSDAQGCLSDIDGEQCLLVKKLIDQSEDVRSYVAKVNLEGRKLVGYEVFMLREWHEKSEQREACRAIAAL